MSLQQPMAIRLSLLLVPCRSSNCCTMMILYGCVRNAEGHWECTVRAGAEGGALAYAPEGRAFDPSPLPLFLLSVYLKVVYPWDYFFHCPTRNPCRNLCTKFGNNRRRNVDLYKGCYYSVNYIDVEQISPTAHDFVKEFAQSVRK